MKPSMPTNGTALGASGVLLITAGDCLSAWLICMMSNVSFCVPAFAHFFSISRLRSSEITTSFICRNQQCCLHFWLLLEDPFEQLSGIVKNVDRHGKSALFLIMLDSCLRIIQAKTKAVRRRKSVNNATISYSRTFTAFGDHHITRNQNARAALHPSAVQADEFFRRLVVLGKLLFHEDLKMRFLAVLPF